MIKHKEEKTCKGHKIVLPHNLLIEFQNFHSGPMGTNLVIPLQIEIHPPPQCVPCHSSCQSALGTALLKWALVRWSGLFLLQVMGGIATLNTRAIS